MQAAAAADPRAATQPDVGVEHRVGAHLHFGLDGDPGRLEERHTGLLQLGAASVEQRPVGPRQVVLIVDAQPLVGIRQLAGGDRPLGGGRVDSIRQVELALYRVRLEGRQIGEDPRRRQEVETDVDLRRGQLGLAGIGGLDDPAQPPPLDGHPAQRARLLEACHRQGAPRAVRRLHHPSEGDRADQRHVSRQHQQPRRTFQVALDLGQGMTRAVLVALLDPGDLLVREGLAHRRGAVPHHDQQPRAAGGAGGGQDARQHRPAGDLVQHLGARRA